MSMGIDVLDAFALVTPLLGKVIGRPFAMTAAREFDYRTDPDAAKLDEARNRYRAGMGSDYEDFRDVYREGHGIRVVFAHFSMVDDYMMAAPGGGRTSMRQFILPPGMTAGGIEIASSARTAMFHAVKGSQPYSTVLSAEVLGAPLLSYAFPVFDDYGVLVGGVSFGIDLSGTMSTAMQLRGIIGAHDDAALRSLSGLLEEELGKASASALQIRRQAEHSQSLARTIRDRGARIADIAAELQVLAINTAIEATKVGGQGKGVGVIAKKMKEISEFTTKTVEEITRDGAELEQGAAAAVQTTLALHAGASVMQDESVILATTAERLLAQKQEMEKLVEASVESVAHTKENLEAIYRLLPREAG